MVDYPYAGILVADAVTFRRATNAAVTVYDVNDLASATPLVLKDLSGLPLPNPLTSSSDGFVQPFVTTSEGVKLIGGGLTVVEYSHKGMRDAAAAAATAAQTAAANAASAVTASLSSAVSNAQSAATAAANAAALVGTPADSAIAAAINGSGTATKAALSATYASLASLAGNPDALIVGAITRDGNGAATGAGVIWPDGTPGTYTGTPSAGTPGAIDSYTITYGSPVTKTYTQPTVTRNASGAVITRPAITVA